MVPNATDEKAFGTYLPHYAIILDFNKDMKVSTDDFVAQLIKLGYGPNPSSRTVAACSKIRTLQPDFRSAIPAERPPMPAPTIKAVCCLLDAVLP